MTCPHGPFAGDCCPDSNICVCVADPRKRIYFERDDGTFLGTCGKCGVPSTVAAPPPGFAPRRGCHEVVVVWQFSHESLYAHLRLQEPSNV